MRLGDQFTNPSAYYQSTDPSQIPVQTWPMNYGPYGPWPGYFTGERLFTQADAERNARERQHAMEQRAATTDVPEYKYISAEGQLNPAAAAALRQAAMNQQQQPPFNKVINEVQKKIIVVMIIGAVISALTR